MASGAGFMHHAVIIIMNRTVHYGARMTGCAIIAGF